MMHFAFLSQTKDLCKGLRDMGKKSSLLLDALAQIFFQTSRDPENESDRASAQPDSDFRNASESRVQFYGALYLLLAVWSKGLASILINDLSDREIDRRAGKVRWITSVPLAAGIAIPLLLLLSAFAALIYIGSSPLVFAVFFSHGTPGNPLFLSPIRLKERGIWGIFAYALSAAILHAFVPGAFFRPAVPVLFLLFIAVFSEKLVQISFHQVVDFEDDSSESVNPSRLLPDDQSGAASPLRSMRCRYIEPCAHVLCPFLNKKHILFLP